jgi:antibiotic biosynthesis monooxygenase (ABM) superfamily enzyme
MIAAVENVAKTKKSIIKTGLISQKMRQKIITSAIIWIGLYPILLIVSTLLQPFIGSWHFALKTLITTLIVVPIMVFFVIPLVRKIFTILGIIK